MARRRSAKSLGCLLAAGLLLAPASQAQLMIPEARMGQAQLSWSSFEQYQAENQLLDYDAHGQAVGTLLIWPELHQTHLWLPLAQYWQQNNWHVLLLLPSAEQQVFDPGSEQPSPPQLAWLAQETLRLNALISRQAADIPLLMLAQGSAALWYQQWVDSTELAPPQALILFDALPEANAKQQMLAISLARSPYPVLDIYSRPDSPLAWHNQQRRQQQLRQREKTGYAVQHFHGAQMLNKQIAGWLVRLGWLPLSPNAPAYLQEQRRETRLSRPNDTGIKHQTAPP